MQQTEMNLAYSALVEQYKGQILGFVQQYKGAMGHPNPDYAAQTCGIFYQMVCDGQRRLRNSEFLHKPFHEAVDAIGNLALELIPNDCGGAAWPAVNNLENAVKKLSVTMTNKDTAEIRKALCI